MTRPRLRLAAPLASFLGSLALAACSAGPGASPAPSASTEPSIASSPSTAAVTILEDAGLENELAPGTYESRLFQPKLTFELAAGWFRRDDIGEQKLNLRRKPDGAEDVTFLSRLDFLQCGTAEVIEQPDAAAIADGLSGSDQLDVTTSEVSVGDRTATMIRLNGGGEPVPEEDFGRSNEFGCIITIGDAPFPADGGWVTMLRADVMQVVVLDVGDTTVLIRARPAADPEGFFDFVVEFLKTTSLG